MYTRCREENSMTTSYLQAITEAMQEELERDDNVFVLGEDVGNKGGVFRATDGLYDTYGEDRVIDSTFAESGLVGVFFVVAMYVLRQIDFISEEHKSEFQ